MLFRAILPLAILSAAPAAAQTVAAQPAPAPAVATSEPVFAAEPVADTTLKAAAGREDVNQTTLSTSTATVARNSVGDNSVTGDAKIADQAFQNLSGLSLVNVNTGNNVAINATMNVNISINAQP